MYVCLLATVVQFVTSVHVHVCSWLSVYCLSGLPFFPSYFYVSYSVPYTCTCISTYVHVLVHISSTPLAASREGKNESSQVAERSECAGLPDYQEEGEKTTPHLDCDQEFLLILFP